MKSPILELDEWGVRGADWSVEHICGRAGKSDPEERAQILLHISLGPECLET
jgi:hypothetical protein